MAMGVDELVEQARQLAPEERVVLLDALNELVSPPDAEWEKAWASEAADRLAAYERGEIETVDFDVVMERMRREFVAR
jgi:Putative addiction module component